MSLQVSHFFSLGDFNRKIVDPGSRRLPYVKRTGMFVGNYHYMQSECVSGAVEVELLDFRSENPSGEFLLFRNL